MNTQLAMPSPATMYRALVSRDAQFEGVFVVGVKTTGIFCRPTCPARKPKRENVQFYRSVQDALSAGYRPCRRCRPLHAMGSNPDWLDPLLAQVEADPSRRWTDADLRDLNVPPSRVRRWFKAHHGITFHGYLRTRRLAQALGQIQVGSDVTQAALANGYQSLSGFRDSFKQWVGQVPTEARQQDQALVVNRVLTPLGPMIAAANDDGLCLLEFADRRMLQTQFKRLARYFKVPLAPGDHPWIDRTRTQLGEYFQGRRRSFYLSLQAPGSDFQRKVWDQLQTIPFGETQSYDALARRLDRAGAQRAVGRANGDNRFAIVIPCHRVIRSDGSLSGYGGGLWRKQWLLDHERGVLQNGIEQNGASAASV